MRVRYKLYNCEVRAVCDLTEKQARKKFSELKQSGRCLWVEIIGEEEHDYMQVIDAYDAPEEQVKIQSIYDELFGR